MSTFYEYDLGNGATVLIEGPDKSAGATVRGAFKDDSIVKVQNKFSEAIKGAKTQAQMLLEEIKDLHVDEAEVKWLRLYLGMSFSRVQLYEYLVFFFSVLSSKFQFQALPINSVIWVLIVIVMLQLFYRGCNPTILILCWSIIFIFVNICLSLVHAKDWLITISSFPQLQLYPALYLNPYVTFIYFSI